MHRSVTSKPAATGGILLLVADVGPEYSYAGLGRKISRLENGKFAIDLKCIRILMDFPRLGLIPSRLAPGRPPGLCDRCNVIDPHSGCAQSKAVLRTPRY